jgi:hypothetical protein
VKRSKYLSLQSSFCFVLKFARIMGKHKNKGNMPKASWTQLALGGAMAAGARILRRLSQSVGVVTTSATGTLFQRVNSSAVANAVEWSNLSAVYTQYRTIEMRLTLVPQQSTTATAPYGQGTLIFGTDRSGALATLSSYASVWGLQAPKVHTLQMVKPAVYSARAIDLEDQDFTPVGAPVSLFAVQYAINAPNVISTGVAFLLLDYVVEFKGNQA